MPRHDTESTPPELRRAPKGSRVGRQSLHHTAESLSDMAALAAAWGCSDVEAVRRALAESRKRLKRS
jgi:hypothetical protein